MPFRCLCDRILDDGHFCPWCGRRAARLLPSAAEPVQVAARQTALSVSLQKEGPGKLPFRVRSTSPWLNVDGDPRGVVLDGTHPLRLRIAPDAPAEIGAAIVLETPTGDRTATWWEKDVWTECPIPLTVRRQMPARVIVPARCLVFPERQPVQALFVWNAGDAAANVSLQAPPGFAIIGSQGEMSSAVCEVPPRGTSAVEIRRGSGASAGTLFATWEGNSTAVALEPVTSRRQGGFQPDYIVGVDFGTVNTSVLMRKRSDSTAGTPIGPTGADGKPAARFPSVMWVEAAGERPPVLGAEAFLRVNDTSGQGFLVQRIKTLIRLEQDPYLDFGPQWTTYNLLVLYLRELKRLIDDSLREQGIVDAHNVLYVFCLPVLDADVKYRAQKDRMRAAAAEAGFPASDDEVMWFVEEPVAAALFTVRYLETTGGLKPGARLCVVDSGGGTTDVTIGQVSLDERGRYRFQPEKTGALHVVGNAVCDRYLGLLGGEDFTADDEIGGQVLDMLLMDRWTHAIGKLPDPLWDRLWPTDAYVQTFVHRPSQAARVGMALTGIDALKRRLCERPAETLVLDADRARTCFQNFSTSPVVEAYLAAVMKLLFFTPPTFTYKDDIPRVIQELWANVGVGTELRRIAEGQRIDHIVAVGGANEVREQRDQIEWWSGVQSRMVQTPQDRARAVILGSVQAYDFYPSSTLPFAVTMSITHGERTTEHQVLAAFQGSTGMPLVQRTYEMLPGEGLQVEVARIGDKGRRDVLAACSMSASLAEDVRVAAVPVAGGAISFRLERAGGGWPAWEVRL